MKIQVDTFWKMFELILYTSFAKTGNKMFTAEKKTN